MPKRIKLQNQQTVYFKYADKNNVAVGFINLLDELDPDDYAYFEEHLEELIETKQITLSVAPLGKGNGEISTSDFKLKPDTA